MTEFTEGFESSFANWATRDTSGGGYAITDRWERLLSDLPASPETKPQAGSYSVSKQHTSPTADFDDSIAWALGESFQEFDLYAYIGFYYDGESSQSPLIVELIMDDGVATDGTPSFQSPTNLADNFIGLSITYDINSGAAAHFADVIYRKSAGSTQAAITTSPSITDMPEQLDTKQYFGFRVQVTSTKIRLYTDYTNEGYWLLQSEVDNDSFVVSNLSNLVLNLSSYSVTGNINAAEQPTIDTIRVGTGADIETINTLVQGISLAAQVDTISAFTELGAGGKATITVNDVGLANYASALNDIGNVVVIASDQYSVALFRGEVENVEPVDRDHLLYTVADAGRKLLKQPTNYQNRLSTGTIKHIKTDRLLDAQGQALPTTTGNAISFTQNSKTELSLSPIDTNYTGTQFSSSAGSVDNLYFDVGGDATSNILKYIAQTPTGSDYFTLEFDVWIKSGVNVSDLVCDWKWKAYDNLSTAFDTTPVKMQVYNYNTASADDTGDQLTGSLNSFSPSFTLSDVGTVSDYFDTVGGANASDFVKHTFVLRVTMGSTNNQSNVFIYNLNIDITFDADSEAGLGLGIIKTGSTNAAMLFDNTPTWQLTDFALSDGFGKSDTWVHTATLDDQLDTAFTQSNTSYTLTRNLTDVDQYAITADMEHMMLHEMLQQVTNMLNAIWWFDAAGSTIRAQTLDNLTSTGVTIQESDIIGGLAGLTSINSAEQLRSNITVVGSQLTKTVAITPEYTLDGGVTEDVYINSDLTTKKSIDEAAANYAIIHGYTRKEVRFGLDFTNPNQDYSGIKLGQTIAVQLPSTSDTSFHNFSSAGDGELLIRGYQYDYVARQREVLSLICQRRYNV